MYFPTPFPKSMFCSTSLYQCIKRASRSCLTIIALYRQVRFNHVALLGALNAHVGSVTEYGSVIWSGAAITHLSRFERLQHRFL